MEDQFLYHIIQLNDRTGAITLMTEYPVTHSEACVLLSKQIRWPRHFNLRNILSATDERETE